MPEPVIEEPHAESAEVYLSRFQRPGHAVYLLLIVLLLGALVALPLIRVGVAVSGVGFLRPVLEKHEVRASISGVVTDVFFDRGDSIFAGEVMIVLSSADLDEREKLLRYREARLRSAVADLLNLTGNEPYEAVGLHNRRYSDERALLTQEMKDLGVREEQAIRELERTRQMASAGVLALAELESREFTVLQLRSSRELLARRQVSRWTAELNDLTTELRQIEANLQEVVEERSRYVVVAPATGTVEDRLTVSAGSFVRAGEVLAVISPDAALEAELFVSPKDVGLLQVGMPVRLHVDAFNYSDWGFAPARVISIGSDFSMLEGGPAFRVRAALEVDHLELRNGARGTLRKGMTIVGRFIVAERTLFQLVRDDVSNWFDPRGYSEPKRFPQPALPRAP